MAINTYINTTKVRFVMGRVVMGLVIALVLSVSANVFAQSNRVTAQVMPNKGDRGVSFRTISTDTGRTLPTFNYLGGIGGLIDTNYNRSNYVQLYAQGADLKYAFGAKPTRFRQVVVACSNNVLMVDSSAGRGFPCVSVLIPVTAGASLLDSMYVQFKGTAGTGTAFDDSLFLIVKKYTNRILIKKVFVTYTTSTDTILTPNFGTPLFAKSSITLFGDDVKEFRYMNWTASTPCTLMSGQGFSER